MPHLRCRRNLFSAIGDGSDEPPKVRTKHVAAVIGVFLLAVGAELLYHRLGGA